MAARATGWYPLTLAARLYDGPPRDYGVGGVPGLGEFVRWQEPQIDTMYIGPVRRWPHGKSIFASKVAPNAWSSPYADPTAHLQHFHEGGGIGPVPGSPSMSGLREDVGGVALRLAGTGIGWFVGSRIFGPGAGVIGAVAGYVTGALLSGE